MNKIMDQIDISAWVLTLSGYLSALKDMNDMQSENRYSFAVNLVFLENESVESAIHKYCKKDDVSYREIDLAEELSIIESFLLENYILDSSKPNSEAQNDIKNLHGLRIQEYVALAASFEDDDRRWVVESVDDAKKSAIIFVKIKRQLVAMSFSRLNH